MRRVLAVGFVAAVLFGITPARAGVTYSAPFSGIDTARSCAPPEQSDCTSTPIVDASTGAVRADVVVASGERPIGYGSGSANALVKEMHALTSAVPRLPVTVKLHVSSASSSLGEVHTQVPATKTASAALARTALWVRFERLNCSSSYRLVTKEITSTNGVLSVEDADVELTTYFTEPCHHYDDEDDVRAGTIVVKAGVQAYASLGSLLDPDVGTAESHIDASVTSIDVQDYATVNRTVSATYGRSSLDENTCPYPFLGVGGTTVSLESPGPCLALQPHETRVLRVAVEDDSGLRTAFSLTFLDAAGYTISTGVPTGYAATYCGVTPASLVIPPRAAYVHVRLSDRNWPLYGFAPKCRGVVATEGTISAEFA